jgi:CRISPR-associated protein Csd1
MALDPNNLNSGYRVGRLFAVLEKIQEEASPGLNATIRDRFYGAASSNPVAVFPQLLKLKNHHVAKLENPGRRIYFEKLISEIVGELKELPAHLALAQQAEFAVGYYHQRQDFFTSKKSETISQ